MIRQEASSVLIVSSSDKATEYLKNILDINIFDPVTVCATVGEAERMLLDMPFDIIIVNTPLSDDYGFQFALDANDRYISSGVLMLVKSEFYDQICNKVESQGILLVSKPSTKQALSQALHLLAATRMRIRRLEEKAQTLEAKMKEIRLINRAKWLLIDQLKMSESDAHRYIEKTAMDRCVKKSEVAESIIRTYDE
ncbi:MAG: ANTAR domain-containing response regulator [Acutalibacteraceae bacterium]